VATINKNALKNIGKITAARVVQEADDTTIISINGLVLRTQVRDISQGGRATRGVRLIDLQDGDTVASLARIADADLRRVGAASDEARLASDE
jgi:DNA gyrase subunit A